MKTRHTQILILALAAGVLAGCDSLSRTFGYKKSAPDEFNVLTNPPLIVPPNYNLRPPGSGVSRPAVPQGRELAEILVLQTAPSTQPTDDAEQNLLEKAGGGIVYGEGVREQIENDRRGTTSRSPAQVETLIKDDGTTEQ